MRNYVLLFVFVLLTIVSLVGATTTVTGDVKAVINQSETPFSGNFDVYDNSVSVGFRQTGETDTYFRYYFTWDEGITPITYSGIPAYDLYYTYETPPTSDHMLVTNTYDGTYLWAWKFQSMFSISGNVDFNDALSPNYLIGFNVYFYGDNIEGKQVRIYEMTEYQSPGLSTWGTSATQIGTLTFIPEPATILLLSVGAVMTRLRKRS